MSDLVILFYFLVVSIACTTMVVCSYTQFGIIITIATQMLREWPSGLTLEYSADNYYYVILRSKIAGCISGYVCDLPAARQAR
jgi:hypothetical protein